MKHLRPVSFAAAFALSLGLCAPAFASLASDTFKDVPDGHWAEQGVADVAIKRDLMRGYADGTFRGDKPFTRAQFADSLANLLKEFETLSKTSWRPKTTSINVYADVPPGSERERILTLANDYGLFEGVPGVTPDSFGMERTVTRYEMAKIVDNLMRLAEAKDVVRPRGERKYSFKDVDERAWAYNDVQEVANRYGVMVGFPDGTFRGSEELTRYQYAQAIAQTVPLIRELIKETVGAKEEERRLAQGPWRFQEKQPIRVAVDAGVTTGATTGSLAGLNGRWVAYPSNLFLMVDPKLRFSPALSLDTELGAFWRMPIVGNLHLQPYLGAHVFALGTTPTTIGLGGGMAAYWRTPSQPIGFYLKGGASVPLSGNSGLLTQVELGPEFHFNQNFALTAGFSMADSPATTGKTSNVGFTGGILFKL
jgi:hypothetical protein